MKEALITTVHSLIWTIRQRFSFYNNVYLVFVDHIERPGAAGWGGRCGKAWRECDGEGQGECL